MIEKINSLKSQTQNQNVRALCEKAISTLNEGIYQNIPSQAKVELENALESMGIHGVNIQVYNHWLSTIYDQYIINI
jgi:hypothetical protein